LGGKFPEMELTMIVEGFRQCRSYGACSCDGSPDRRLCMARL
jgi:hypothetical protein